MLFQLFSSQSRQILSSNRSKIVSSARSATNHFLNIGHDATRQYTTHSQLPEEHQMIHEMCRKFADEELAPNAGKWDHDHSFPKEAISQLVRKWNI